MKPIPDTELLALVNEASAEYLLEQRRDGIQKVKQLFHAINALANVDVPKLENDLKKKKEQLAKKQSLLERLRNGDWAALADDGNSTKTGEEK